MKQLNGKPVVNAKSHMVVRVMPKDIKKAIQCDPEHCAIAQGCLHHDGVVSVRIGQRVVLVEQKKQVLRYNLTAQDSKKIKAFDAAGYFQPDVYELVPPKPEPRKQGHGPNKGSHKKRPYHIKSVYRAVPLRHALRVEHDGEKK